MKKAIIHILSFTLLLNTFYTYSMLTPIEKEIVIEDCDNESCSEERNQLNITHLPDDCIEYAFEFLPIEDLLTTKAINTNFHQLVKRVLLRTNRQIPLNIFDQYALKIIDIPYARNHQTIKFSKECTINDLEQFAINFKNIIHQKINQNSLFSADNSENPEEITQLRKNIIINFINPNQIEDLEIQNIPTDGIVKLRVTYETIQDLIRSIDKQIKLEKQLRKKIIRKKIISLTCAGCIWLGTVIIMITLIILIGKYCFERH